MQLHRHKTILCLPYRYLLSFTKAMFDIYILFWFGLSVQPGDSIKSRINWNKDLRLTLSIVFVPLFSRYGVPGD